MDENAEASVELDLQLTGALMIKAQRLARDCGASVNAFIQSAIEEKIADLESAKAGLREPGRAGERLELRLRIFSVGYETSRRVLLYGELD